jgi:hypothetical protein
MQLSPRALWLALLAAALACVLLADVSPALAGPVLPEPVILSQPDGTPIPALPYGDEWASGYETLDGFTIVQDMETGIWSYATVDEQGRLVPSGILPGDATPPQDVAPHLRPSAAANPNQFLVSPAAQAGLRGNSGAQAVVVILVSFSDRSPVGTTPAQWSTAFFGPAPSAADFYSAVSYDQFTLIPAAEASGSANDGVIGWLNLGYPHPNTRGSTGIANRQLTHDAIVAADPYIDFAAYDLNHDGYVGANELHIVIIAAGYETSYGGATASCSPSVWGHRWALSDD